MKKIFLKKIFFTSLSILFLFSGCFSPWAGNEGSIVINFGGQTDAGRFMIESTEIASFQYEIILKGPGGFITQTVQGPGSATVQVTPGTWKLRVRAIGGQPEGIGLGYLPGPFPERMLRALGMANEVTVTAGAVTQVPLEMIPASEVSNLDQMSWAVNFAHSREEIIIINGNLEFNSTLSLPSETRITFMADKNVKLFRAATFDDGFFLINNYSTMILGKDGMEGIITMDGGGVPGGTDSLICVEHGMLEMNNDIVLKNNSAGVNRGGAVRVQTAYVGDEAEFIMNGGTIANNSAQVGGGVHVQDGTFIMNGGSISDNLAEIDGGGVYVQAGTFIMNGGEININKADAGDGGGVHVVFTGTFLLNDGIIGGNEARQSGITGGRGGGVFVAAGGRFIKDFGGGTIYGFDGVNPNIADAPGGGPVLYYDGSPPYAPRIETINPEEYLSLGY